MSDFTGGEIPGGRMTMPPSGDIMSAHERDGGNVTTVAGAPLEAQPKVNDQPDKGMFDRIRVTSKKVFFDITNKDSYVTNVEDIAKEAAKDGEEALHKAAEKTESFISTPQGKITALGASALIGLGALRLKQNMFQKKPEILPPTNRQNIAKTATNVGRYLNKHVDLQTPIKIK